MFSICLSLFLSCLGPTQGVTTAVDSLISEIGTSRLDRHPAPALEAIKSLGRSVEVINGADFERLSVIVLDPSVHGSVRVALVTFLCEKVEAKEALDFLTMMENIATRYRLAVDEKRTEELSYRDDLYWDPSLIREFIERGAPALASHLEDPDRLLDFYMPLLERPRIYFGGLLHTVCLKRFADNPAPLAVRQRYMLRLVERIPGGRGPEAFIPLVTDDIVPRLREIAFDGPVGRYGYNVAAVDLLAEHGDLETARQLRTRAEERGYDGSIVERPGGYIWKIESQHNPKMLLDHIGSGRWIDHSTRLWAFKRAIALGVDKGTLRSSLLEHARHLDSDTRLHYAARLLKELAVQDGILKPEEFTVPPESPIVTHIRKATGAGELPKDARTSGGD